MLLKKLNLFVLNWLCKCGNSVPNDRNFCPQCDREKPLNN